MTLEKPLTPCNPGRVATIGSTAYLGFMSTRSLEHAVKESLASLDRATQRGTFTSFFLRFRFPMGTRTVTNFASVLALKDEHWHFGDRHLCEGSSTTGT